MSRYARRLDYLCELPTRRSTAPATTPRSTSSRSTTSASSASCGELFNELPPRPRGRVQPLYEAGRLEIVTCGATHGFLPLMQQYRRRCAPRSRSPPRTTGATSARIRLGIWLPECGYFPGVDAFLGRADSATSSSTPTASLTPTPRPRYGVYAPIYTASRRGRLRPRRRVVASRCGAPSRGYPGDPDYREFYRDIGWDLDYDYVEPYIQPTGNRKNAGIKYYRITGRTAHKEPYDPARAREQGGEHAGNFLFNREKQIEHLAPRAWAAVADRGAPYDAELYGHWWYEGPVFIDFLIRKVALRPADLPARHAGRLPAGEPRAAGRHPAALLVGRGRLRRRVARRVERLDLPPPAQGRGADGRARARLPGADRARAPRARTRPRASCSSRSRRTGPSS